MEGLGRMDVERWWWGGGVEVPMWLPLDEPSEAWICHINGLTQFIPGVLWRMCDEL